MNKLIRLIAILYVSLLTASCSSVSSREAVTGNRNANTQTKVVKSNIEVAADDYEASKLGAEKLNNEPISQSDLKINANSPTRDQVREALIANNLIGESANGEIGGYKVVHFSHTCNLVVENSVFYVVELKGLLQLASFARGMSGTLIFDESFKLVHNLKAPEPLFCEGNRLFFKNDKMTLFYEEPEREIRGNVLIFTDNAKQITGEKASLNFYKIKGLIN